jgi:hypothetical protein
MSEPENFLARWTRRKRQAAEHPEAKSSAAPEPTVPVVPANPGTRAETAKPEPAVLDSRLRGNERGRAFEPNKEEGADEPLVDLTKLPPIESITAETDIRAFLSPGVPAELSRAALRRVWSADPSIRDFVGLSENSWDFNAPGAIPGFGPLQMTDELRRQIARMVGGLTEPMDGWTAVNEAPQAQDHMETGADEATTPAPTTGRAERVEDHQPGRNSGEETGPTAPLSRCTINNAAVQSNSDGSDSCKPVVRRSHGGALPE